MFDTEDDIIAEPISQSARVFCVGNNNSQYNIRCKTLFVKICACIFKQNKTKQKQKLPVSHKQKIKNVTKLPKINS